MNFVGWILVVFISGGSTSASSNAITSVGPFENKNTCLEAGRATKEMMKYTTKEILWVCVKQ